MIKSSKLLRLLAMLLTITLVAAACGSSSDGADGADGGDDTDVTDGGDTDGGDDADGGDDTEQVDATQGGTLAAVQSAGVIECGGNDTLPGSASLMLTEASAASTSNSAALLPQPFSVTQVQST